MDLDELLAQTSRTFALAIPLLEEPLRREVSVAYLLFRIADTFEDEASWPKDTRQAALHAFARLLDDPSPAHAAAFVTYSTTLPPLSDEPCARLIGETAGVLAALDSSTAASRAAVLSHVRKTTVGMAEIVASSDDGGRFVVRDLPGLLHYCYIVAGIVGEMLTDLFLLTQSSTRAVETRLHAEAVRFGEALQLVNILKDASTDLAAGRSFLPASVPRAELFAIARRDLEAGWRYVHALRDGKASRGVLAFTSMPLLLARAALDVTEERGPSAKVPRDLVYKLVADMNAALDRGDLLG
jgi:farnesyl-diphosphate farnesyltransferase